jgi:hypothetical protein
MSKTIALIVETARQGLAGKNLADSSTTIAGEAIGLHLRWCVVPKTSGSYFSTAACVLARTSSCRPSVHADDKFWPCARSCHGDAWL